jgi:hypothetical protein
VDAQLKAGHDDGSPGERVLMQHHGERAGTRRPRAGS